MNKLTNIKNKILLKIILLLSSLSINFFLFNLIFKYSVKLYNSQNIFFINYLQKNNLIKYQEKISKKLNLIKYHKINNINLREENLLVKNEIEKLGISDKFKSFITNDDVQSFTSHLNNYDFYDSHTPLKDKILSRDLKPTGAYKSYDYNCQLNSIPLLKVCLNDQILKLAYEYLECVPYIYSINTFITHPNATAFTHDFHRDLDNLKWLVVFIYWTETSKDDGSFQQIHYTHKPSDFLSNLLDKNNNNNVENFDKFFNESVPGYGKEEIYKSKFKNEINTYYGKPGKIVICDTMGLHRGMPVQKTPRIATWIRFGVFKSRQEILKHDFNLSNINLSKEANEYIKGSKNKFLLSSFIK